MDTTSRTRLAQALEGHRLDTLNQDSGHHCTCRSDSRFQQGEWDGPWATFAEHLADVALHTLGLQ